MAAKVVDRKISHPLELTDKALKGISVFARKQLLAWYSKNSAPHPWRLLWAKHKNPYHVWVSEVMLQQTILAVVTPRYLSFIKQFPSVESLAKASSDEIRIAVRGMGYYRRFDLFHRAVQKLYNERQANEIVWPVSRKEWIELPGVGEYMSAALASICLDEPVGLVDGNVERVICRLFDARIAPNAPQNKVHYRKIASALVAPNFPGAFNQAMMELGQSLCRSDRAECSSCPLSEICVSFKRGSQQLAPGPKLKKAKVATELVIVIPCDHSGNVATYQRPSSAKFLKSYSGFPIYQRVKGGFVQDGTNIALKKRGLKRQGVVRHNITHHKITAEIFRATPEWSDLNIEKTNWICRVKADKTLVSNLDRKALTVVCSD